MMRVWPMWSEPTADRVLQATAGRILGMFVRRGCSAYRAADTRVSALAVGRLDTLVYLEAKRNAAQVQYLEEFHLPALFPLRDGAFHAPLDVPPTTPVFADAIDPAVAAPAVEAP